MKKYLDKKKYSRLSMRGRRLLGDAKETTLEEVLDVFNAEQKPVNPTKRKNRPNFFPIPLLNAFAVKNFRATQSIPLAVTGRQLPLIYRLVSGLVSAPHFKTVLIFDTEGRFDVTRLCCGVDDIRHVYVQRLARCGITGSTNGPADRKRISPNQLREQVAAAEQWIFYGKHNSGARELWGTVVIGAIGAGDIVAAWRGWLDVERANVPGFSIACSAEEAIGDRERRQEAVDAALWVASAGWGSFTFTESVPHAPESHHSNAMTTGNSQK
ncbi:hypothetical protein GCG54_00011852 [Colletotrichum gloeosporioides]|uniref:Uncharacterized protein n=1 Tax=Colletotrichum gloeosporioides TaxID=474922 RepID=A0A8H4FCP7_COLGL|nr:uncharacterized protein GCG54_00011852 [Colletotrichum gloeosporioides]KAF3797762.1 hypothetical protein GCG54_00011852 [Colletotrichum gloeosporioides]